MDEFYEFSGLQGEVMKKREHNSFKTPLVVEVMPSGKRFKLYNQFTYRWRTELWDKLINVPAGFVTDFASIPRFARMLIPKLGKYNKAAVIHDAMYQNAILDFWFNRSQADLCFRDAMRDLGVAKWKRTLMYWVVRLFGWMAWRKR